MTTPLVGTGFDTRIGTRFKPGQTQAEFYDTQSNQVFANPEQLASFVGSTYGRGDVNAGNVFSIVQQGFNPRSQELDRITNELNQTQTDIYGTGEASPKRQSSSLQASIDTEQSGLAAALKEYADLKAKLTSFQSPNYQEAYNEARNTAGIPALEGQYAGVRADRRELPYVERARTGNAGVATESQLGDQTYQKDIPLGIKEANIIDRLKLAESFVNNSLKFKEMDANAARQSLTDAINLVTQSIGFSRDSLNTSYDRLDTETARADAFAKENGITSSFYKIPGSDLVFDTKTREALSFEEYKRRGGVGVLGQDGAFADVQELVPQTVQEERAIVTDLASKYVDAGITLNDTLAVAQAKVSGSRIYQDAVRPPARSGGGGGGSGGSGSSDVEQFADAVFNGRLTLSGVPQKLRTQVDKKVQELKAGAQNKYDTEFESRIDYDREVRDLETAIRNGESISAKFSEIVQALVNDYGRFISEQEIEATIRNLLS